MSDNPHWPIPLPIMSIANPYNAFLPLWDGEKNWRRHSTTVNCYLCNNEIIITQFLQYISQTIAEQFACKIFTFGSYRLGVHAKGTYLL